MSGRQSLSLPQRQLKQNIENVLFVWQTNVRPPTLDKTRTIRDKGVKCLYVTLTSTAVKFLIYCSSPGARALWCFKFIPNEKLKSRLTSFSLLEIFTTIHASICSHTYPRTKTHKPRGIFTFMIQRIVRDERSSDSFQTLSMEMKKPKHIFHNQFEKSLYE